MVVRLAAVDCLTDLLDHSGHEDPEVSAAVLGVFSSRLIIEGDASVRRDMLRLLLSTAPSPSLPVLRCALSVLPHVISLSPPASHSPLDSSPSRLLSHLPLASCLTLPSRLLPLSPLASCPSTAVPSHCFEGAEQRVMFGTLPCGALHYRGSPLTVLGEANNASCVAPSPVVRSLHPPPWCAILPHCLEGAQQRVLYGLVHTLFSTFSLFVSDGLSAVCKWESHMSHV